MKLGLIFALLVCLGVTLAHPKNADKERQDRHMHKHGVQKIRSTVARGPEQDPAFWNNMAQNTLAQHLARVPILGQAKNVILFMGDGMSIPTLTAARIYKGGEQSKHVWEDFDYVGLSKTYCVDAMVADSACSGTAYLSGVKTNTAMLGVTAAVRNKVCEDQRNVSNHVDSILRKAQVAGKATGFVTTTRVTHASPANTYAHIADRDWESDADMALDGVDTNLCDDIAEQLIRGQAGKNLNVMFGGGRGNFRSIDMIDEEGKKGYRLDGTDLIAEWQNAKTAAGATWGYAWDRASLERINLANTDHILGLFDKSHMDYHFDNNDALIPTLPVMVRTAIASLKNNANGFVLFVEGGLIDRAHHDTRAQRALEETLQLEEAVREALLVTDPQDTLIVVTSDHAHTFSLGGYPERGGDLLGIALMSDVDGRPYSTLSYANGPGYKPAEKDGDRYNIHNDDMYNNEYEYPAVAPLLSETHGGDDVAVFAKGPWAQIFTGTYEENFIPHAISYAACLGSGITVCNSKHN